MKRKVIKQGHNTLTFTIPSKWAKKNNLNSDSELFIREQEDDLIISRVSVTEKKEIDLDVSEMDSTMVVYYIRHMYRNGYNLNRITYKNKDTNYYRNKQRVSVFSLIQKEVNRLVGMEILERKNNSCLLKCFVDEGAEDYDSFLRRIFLLVSMMMENTAEAVKKNDKESMKMLLSDHDNLTKFISYCFRVLNIRGYKSVKHIALHHSLLEMLEMIVDILELLSLEADNYFESVDSKISSYITHIKSLFDQFTEFFYRFKEGEIARLAEFRHSLHEKIRKAVKTCNKEEVQVLTRLDLIPIIILRYLASVRFSMQH